MTQELAVREKKAVALAATIRGDLFLGQVKAALPGDVSPQRFARAAATAVLANPDIAQCEEASVINSLLRSAQDGLLCDGREAALVKYGQKAQYQPMVGGFRKIAAESGWQIKARVVYENDLFEYTEEPFNLVHHPVRPGAERGPIIAAYAIARRIGSEPMPKVMYAEDIEKRRQVAKSDNIWKGWTAEMYEKTVVRNLFGDLPLGDREAARAQRVLAASALEPAESTALVYGPVAGELTAAPSPDVDSGPSIKGEPESDGQQAEEAAKTSESGDASSVPDSDEEPPLDEPVAKPAFEAPKGARAVAARIKELGATPVMGHENKTLADLPTDGQWFTWALNGGSPQWTPEFRATFEEYVQLAHPEIWKAHVDAGDYQEQLG